MAKRSDGQPRTSELQLAEIAGIQAPLRYDWARKGRLRQGGRGGYYEGDAVEVAALKAIIDGLGPTDGPIAWKQVRPEVPGLASSQYLLLVFDQQDKTAALARTIQEVVANAPYGRPTRVVDLAQPIKRVRAAFARVTSPS